jgi:hypothetical protein
MFQVDLHAHTCRSFDGWTRPRDLVRRAAAAGLDRVAVTDHGTLRGALEAREHDPGRVIVGEEIRCREAVDLIGLFLSVHVPDGLPASETAQRIREQGGVVYVPHPFAYLRGSRAKAALVVPLADVIEAFNARAFLPAWNRAAAAAALERGVPAAASSDAHFPWEIGRARTLLPPFSDAAGFRAALGQARPGLRQTTTPLIQGASFALRAWRAAFRRS